MRRKLFCPLALLVLVPALAAGDDPKTPAEQYQGLLKDVQAAQQEAIKAYQAAKNDEDKQKAIAAYRKAQRTFAGRFLELAEKNPKDDVAIDALIWVAQSAMFTPDADKAVDVLIKEHLANAKVGALTRRLSHEPSPAAEKLLRAYLEKSTRREVQAEALLNLAQYLKSKADMARMVKGSEIAKQVEQIYGKDVLQQLQALNPEQIGKEAEGLLERVIEKYADVKSPVRNPVEEAKPLLFEMRHLSIGKAAPEIEGEDIDGKKFKLSDYRGKVVVLDFWGHW